MRLFNRDINMFHPYGKQYSTTGYYCKFANELLSRLTDVSDNTVSPDMLRDMAVRLTLYFEDIVADSGQWRMFSHKCQQLYGFPVPIYHGDKEYFPDEPSLDATNYLVWLTFMEMDEVYPDADSLKDADLGLVAYQMMDEEFENAPVNDELAVDVKALIDGSATNFDKLRMAMRWILRGCYCTSGQEWDDYVAAHYFEFAQGKNMSKTEILYVISSVYIFIEPTGPLALTCREWLKAFYEVTGNEVNVPLLDEIEHAVSTEWHIEINDGQTLHLLGADGKEIDVSLDALHVKPEQLNGRDYIFATFVRFRGQWELNGVLSADANENEYFNGLKKQMDEERIVKDNARKTVAQIVKAAGGKPILYFSNAAEMKDFARKHIPLFLPLAQGLRLDDPQSPLVVFVVNTEKQVSAYVLEKVAWLIKDPDNPYYAPEKIDVDGFDLIANTDEMRSELLSYLIAHDYLPDLLEDPIVSKEDSLAQRRGDTDFVMRVIRRNEYKTIEV